MTDAHILLEPLNAQLNDECTLLTHSEIKAFYTPGPNLCGAVGFVIWPITVRPPQFCGLNNLYTRSVAGVSGQTGNLYPRAISHRINAAGWAWETPTSPQVAGLFNRQDYGISGLISGKNSGAQSYMFLAPHRNEQTNFWLGYCTQSTAEFVTGSRVIRLTYEYLGQNMSKIMQTAHRGSVHNQPTAAAAPQIITAASDVLLSAHAVMSPAAKPRRDRVRNGPASHYTYYRYSQQPQSG